MRQPLELNTVARFWVFLSSKAPMKKVTQPILYSTDFTMPAIQLGSTICGLSFPTMWTRPTRLQEEESHFFSIWSIFFDLNCVEEWTNWYFLGIHFQMKGSTFERLIMTFTDIISDTCFVGFVKNVWDKKKKSPIHMKPFVTKRMWHFNEDLYLVLKCRREKIL